MRVFLDIGGHLGESLIAAKEPRWGFDRIVTFEPASACWPTLERLADERTQICRFGLWTEDATIRLHDPGEIGASIHPGKALGRDVEECDFRDSAAWFARHVSGSDELYVKINVEGAECDLLEHLLSAGELSKVDHMAVHFDVAKVPGMEHRERETRALLDAAEVPYVPAGGAFFGINTTAKTRHWLLSCGTDVPSRLELAGRRALYRLRLRVSKMRGRS